MAFDEGRPFPVMQGVAPLAEGGYAAFDLESARTTRLRLERRGDGPRLIVSGEAGESVARPQH